MKIPNDIKSDLCNRLNCHPDDLPALLESMSKDDILRELIAWKLGYAAWWDTIKRWIEFAESVTKDNNNDKCY